MDMQQIRQATEASANPFNWMYSWFVQQNYLVARIVATL